MKIALDFDKTYTADPDFWGAFIDMAENHGHSVTIVTIRDEVHDGIDWASVDGDPHVEIVWCDGHPKKDFCKALGLEFDWWIDDDPHAIVNGSSMKHPEQLKKWRLTDKHRGSKLEPSGHSEWFVKKGLI